jgi:protease PrsW
MLAMGPGAFLVAAALATMTAVPYGLLLLWLDRNEKEPLLLVGTAFLWGAAVATIFAGVFNSLTGEIAFGVTGNAVVADFMTASFAAPLSEELMKGFALLCLFLLFRHEFDDVLDGVLYGAIVGLGFAWFENITYYVQAAQAEGMGGLLKNAWARGVVSASGGSHAAYTALTGIGFGLVRVLRRGVLRWLLVPFFWSLSMFAHFAWNTFVGMFMVSRTSEAVNYLVNLPIAVLVLQVPFLALIALVVAVVWRHQNRVITEQLAGEAEDVVSRAQLAGLVPARRRTLRGLGRFFTRGPAHWWHHRQLDLEQIELAFVKWHHARDQETRWSADQDQDVLRLRAAVRARQGRLR